MDVDARASECLQPVSEGAVYREVCGESSQNKTGAIGFNDRAHLLRSMAEADPLAKLFHHTEILGSRSSQKEGGLAKWKNGPGGTRTPTPLTGHPLGKRMRLPV